MVQDMYRGIDDSRLSWGGHESRQPSDREDLENAAVKLLLKRGYKVVRPEGDDFRELVGSPSERLESSVDAFNRLSDWVDASVDLIQPELIAAALPIFVHLFLALTEDNKVQSARSFLRSHIGLFGKGTCTGRGARILESLQSVKDAADLEGTEISLQYKQEERTVVMMSQFARDLLLSRLLSPDMVGPFDIFQRRVKVVDPRDAAGCQLVPEGIDSRIATINETTVHCKVDAQDPPMAYGNGRSSEQDNGRPVHGVFSATNVAQKCGLPLPKASSNARIRASAHFSDLLSRREDVGKSCLPSIAVYTIQSGGVGDIHGVAVSNDGRYCAAGVRGVRLWDLDAEGLSDGTDGAPGMGASEEGQNSDVLPSRRLSSVYRCDTLQGHSGRVLDVAFSPDSQLLLSGGQDGAIRLWHPRHRHGLCTFLHSEPVWAIDWCPVGHYFASSGSKGEGLLWSVERSTPLRVLAPSSWPRISSTPASGKLMSPDIGIVRTHPSCKFAALAAEESLVLWDLGIASPARVFQTGKSATSIAFSADGNALAVGCMDGSLEFWDIAAGKRRQRVAAAHSGPVYAVDFSWPSPDSSESVMVSGGADNQVKLWLAQDAHLASCDTSGAPTPVAKFQAEVPVARGRFTPANLLLVAGVSQEE